jgi:glycosyltransferase involved in cell wall biosynthesis
MNDKVPRMEHISKIIGVIVVPCYNEETRIDVDYFEYLIRELGKFHFYLLFVNDGSSDSTGALLDELGELGAKTLHLEKNVGKAEAIRNGLIASNSAYPNCEVFGYLDADAAFGAPDVIELALSISEKYRNKDVLFLSGSRISMAGSLIQRNKLRHIIGRAIVTILNLDKKIRMYDPQSGLKVFRVKNFDQLLLGKPFKTKWFVDLEILSRLSAHSLEVIEQPVKKWVEVGGSKLNIQDALTIFKEVIIIKKIIRDSRR